MYKRELLALRTVMVYSGSQDNMKSFSEKLHSRNSEIGIYDIDEQENINYLRYFSADMIGLVFDQEVNEYVLNFIDRMPQKARVFIVYSCCDSGTGLDRTKKYISVIKTKLKKNKCIYLGKQMLPLFDTNDEDENRALDIFINNYSFFAQRCKEIKYTIEDYKKDIKATWKFDLCEILIDNPYKTYFEYGAFDKGLLFFSIFLLGLMCVLLCNVDRFMIFGEVIDKWLLGYLCFFFGFYPIAYVIRYKRRTKSLHKKKIDYERLNDEDRLSKALILFWIFPYLMLSFILSFFLGTKRIFRSLDFTVATLLVALLLSIGAIYITMNWINKNSDEVVGFINKYCGISESENKAEDKIEVDDKIEEEVSIEEKVNSIIDNLEKSNIRDEKIALLIMSLIFGEAIIITGLVIKIVVEILVVTVWKKRFIRSKAEVICKIDQRKRIKYIKHNVRKEADEYYSEMNFIFYLLISVVLIICTYSGKMGSLMINNVIATVISIIIVLETLLSKWKALGKM